MIALAPNADDVMHVVLRAENVGVTFAGAGRPVEAIRNVDFELRRGEKPILRSLQGLVGCAEAVVGDGGVDPSRTGSTRDGDAVAALGVLEEHEAGSRVA